MNKNYYKTYDEAIKYSQMLKKSFEIQPPYKGRHGWIVEYREKEIVKK